MFYNQEHDNPDHLVKTWCLSMIGSIYEEHCEVEKLWQSGRSNGRRDHANFGRHIGQNYS